jgi:hypothetical protein
LGHENRATGPGAMDGRTKSGGIRFCARIHSNW